MARIITNLELSELDLDTDETLWAYNGLDCTITREIYDALVPQLDEYTRRTYDFERGMLGPAMHLMMRGLRVDEEVLDELVPYVQAKKTRLYSLLNRLAEVMWDKPLNYNSPPQLKTFFYETLSIEKIYARDKGKFKLSTNRATLEKIRDSYPRGKLFARLILELRDADKQLSVLTTKKDADGRMRCSYNVAGTETGRWSSSASAFRTGSNLQNVTPVLREMFIPDEGQTLFYADLDQAESRVVAYLSEDEDYIDACESGDLHTTVAKMIWPELPWPGDLEGDKKVAEQPYYLHFSYRDLCKRAGHGTNYGLQPKSLQNHLKIQLKYAIRFHLLYLGGEVALSSLERWHKQDPDGGFDLLIEGGEIVGEEPKPGQTDKRLVQVRGAFPGIRKWHDRIAQELELNGTLITPFNRKRQFWGRPNDAATLREAIAFVPQSTVGDLLNVGLYRIWQELEPVVQTLGQVHDAVLGQISNELLDENLPRVLNCMVNPLIVNGRVMTIPSSLELGLNWGKFNDSPKKGRINLHGMKGI